MIEKNIRINIKDYLLIGEAHRCATERFVRNVSELGLDITFDQWLILGPIWQLKGASQKALGKISCKDKTNVTRIIDSLEKKNLLVRVTDQLDQRVNRVILTKLGEQLFYDVLPIMQKTRDQMNENISESDKAIFKSVLAQLIENHESYS